MLSCRQENLSLMAVQELSGGVYCSGWLVLQPLGDDMGVAFCITFGFALFAALVKTPVFPDTSGFATALTLQNVLLFPGCPSHPSSVNRTLISSCPLLLFPHSAALILL